MKVPGGSWILLRLLTATDKLAVSMGTQKNPELIAAAV
jgi:hypothetical protein